ncbi:hypothetical protein WA026_021398 [Henosepilachna vigintioctopunctata]|uniref:Uncharacterized protein n=1 Tax=Henosepilachna vigintioctopunctata TaxID=420089 RepID=A0AAW1TZL7_9CUCU
MEYKENKIPWLDDDALSGSTRTPEVLQESSQLTLAIFLVAAVVAITLLFAIGLFMDCRHQKIDDEEAQKRSLWKAKFRMLKKNRMAIRSNDRDCIVENMEENEPSTSNGII